MCEGLDTVAIFILGAMVGCGVVVLLAFGQEIFGNHDYPIDLQ